MKLVHLLKTTLYILFVLLLHKSLASPNNTKEPLLPIYLIRILNSQNTPNKQKVIHSIVSPYRDVVE